MKRIMRRPFVETPFGFRFRGLESMQSGEFEGGEGAQIAALLKDADYFVNVGANFGYYCALAQSMGVRTLAIEPVAANMQVLLENIRENDWGENITILPVAASSAPGTVQIFGMGTGASIVRGWARNPAVHGQLVPTARLDDLVARDADMGRALLLIDVEGWELEVLKGARAILEGARKPTCIVEITYRAHRGTGEANPDFRATFEFLFDCGYSVFAAHDTTREITPQVLDDILAGDESAVHEGNYLAIPRQA